MVAAQNTFANHLITITQLKNVFFIRWVFSNELFFNIHLFFLNRVTTNFITNRNKRNKPGCPEETTMYDDPITHETTSENRTTQGWHTGKWVKFISDAFLVSFLRTFHLSCCSPLHCAAGSVDTSPSSAIYR